MLPQIKNLVNSLNKPKNWLVLANVFVVFFLIILGNAKVIPLDMGDFVFFSILALAFALYRPGWVFLFFCGTVPLENIDLAPVNLGMTIRPYQFIGGILILALIIRKLTGRLNFKLPRFNLADWAVIILVIAGFLSAIGTSIDASIGVPMMAPIKLSIILLSFAALCFLTRIYIQDIPDLKKTIPFFLSSTIVVALYGIWQNIVFLHGGNSFEAMPGRPNATFTEADWLGAFIVLAITFIYALLYYRHSELIRDSEEAKNLPYDTISNGNEQILRPAGRRPQDDGTSDNAVLRMTSLYVFLILLFIVLILTVSRSAWLAAFAAYVIFVWTFFSDLRFKNWKWKETAILKLKIISTLIVAVLVVFVFHLTNFQLGNRVQSARTGLQKITVSCDASCGRDALQCVSTGIVIQDVSELEKYGCKFINLEDIANEKAAGNFVTEVYRKDPNFGTRSAIYQKSWQEIKKHPIFGIGWGSIGQILGRDGRGIILNSSNIFLQTWLGAGLIGILGLLGLLGWILFNAIKNFFHVENHLQKAFYLFIIVSWFGIVIFNLFNAGIFLGFLWVWLSITNVGHKEHKA